MALQDAAPPEVARKLLNEQCGDFGGAASRFVLNGRLQKTLVFSLVFRFPDATRAGRPRPDGTSASLPLSMSAKRFSWFQS
jgi:hypothetical protein